MTAKKIQMINASGQRRTKQLFLEMYTGMPIDQRTQTPEFTLFNDKPGYINFGREYIELEDLTGYHIAMKYFGNYDHWTKLMNCPWFVNAKKVWDKEIEAGLNAKAMQKLVEIAQGEGPQALQAAKFIATKGYATRPLSLKGRPSAEEVEGHLKEAAREKESIADDASRLSLVK